MIALRLADIESIVAGRLVRRPGTDPAFVVDGSVQTDSRHVETGSIFFALPGEVTDGHEFAAAAVGAGAGLIVSERELELDANQIVVAEGVTALGALAAAVVERVRNRGRLTVVGITGSNGKTTTKNLLRAVLAAHGPTVAPRSSFNNHVGAPISMLGVAEDTRYLIVEMGASRVGEIARLASLAKPDVAVVLKVGLAHVGEFGGVEAVQAAKAELVTGLGAAATAVLNADDPRVAAMAQLTAAKVRWFGLSDSADVRAESIDATADGTSFDLVIGEHSHPVRLRILGEHHVLNALAAVSVAVELGISAPAAISEIETVSRAARWRMELLEGPGGSVVINDAYNASPDSMAAALKALAQVAGSAQRSIAVLGEMAELGEYSDEEHDRIGRLAVRLNLKRLIVVGHRARHIHNAAGLEGSWDGESQLVGTADEAYDLLRDDLGPGDVVLVKSSKSAGLRFLGDRLAGVTE